MNNILLMHGPNLNLLGQRNKEYYGSLTLRSIEDLVTNEAKNFNYNMITYQSNHEGNLIDKLQKERKNCVAIIINPGAFTHYSYALYDALLDTQLPIVEVHLSDMKQREEWRSISVTAPACIGVIWGKKEKGYVEALHMIVEYLKHDE